MQYSDGATLDGLQQAVDRLAARLGRSVAIDDTQGRLVVASGHFGEEDELRVFAIVHRYSDPRVLAHFRAAGIYTWTEPGRVPANPELRFKARVCCPIRDHGILFGHLFLIDEGIEDADVDEAAAATVQIGQLMYRRLTLHEEARQHAADVVRELLSDDAADRRRARELLDAAELVVTVDPCAALAVTVLEQPSDRGTKAGPDIDPEVDIAADVQADLQAAVELATRDRLGAASLAWVRPTDAVVLLFGRAVPAAMDVAERIESRMSAVGRRVVAGIGPAGSGERAAAESYAQARLAARAARLLPETGPIATADSLGVYGLLLRLPAEELDESRYPEELRRLIAADANDSFLETLECYLAHAGDVTATAAALHVHRSTLYYRLGRIEEIAGVDLHDGNQLLWLHLGLKLRHLVEDLAP